MRVRLTRKLADRIDGIDLSHQVVGDVIDLPERTTRTLMAEGWAILERRTDGSHDVVAFRRADDLGQQHD